MRFQITLPGTATPAVIAFYGTLNEDGAAISGTLTVTERHSGAEQVRQGRWEARFAR